MIKLKVEISDGKGYHKVLFIICAVEMREVTIAAAERFLWCGMGEMEKRDLLI